jgi:hypothetical protein
MIRAILAAIIFTAAVICQLTAASARQSGLAFALLMASLFVATSGYP